MFKLYLNFKNKKKENNRKQLAQNLIGIEKNKLIRLLQIESEEYLKFADGIRILQSFHENRNLESATHLRSELRNNMVFAALTGSKEYEGALKTEIRKLKNWLFVNGFDDSSEEAFLNAAASGKLEELADEAVHMALTCRSRYEASFNEAAYKMAKQKWPTLIK